MRRETLDELLAKIDALIGLPEMETPDERAARAAMIEANATARKNRRAPG